VLHLVGYFVEKVVIYGTQQDVKSCRGAGGRKCAWAKERQGTWPLRKGNKATATIEMVASCYGIALQLEEKKAISHTFGHFSRRNYVAFKIYGSPVQVAA
jgi:hypothetical protein